MKKLFIFLLFCSLFLTQSYSQEIVVLNSSTTTVKDATLSSLLPDNNYGTSDIRFSVYNWTSGGVHNIVRSMVDFDLSGLPSNIEILDAKLILYHAAFPQYNVIEHSGDNEFYIERIIEKWNEDNTTWNTQPASTAENRAYAPNSTSNTQNYVINVTSLVQDMINNLSKSYGFMLKHVAETPYRNNIFASSEHEDISLHQELILTYNVVTSTETLAQIKGFSVFPNPTDSYLQIEALGDDVISKVVVRDMLGRRIKEVNWAVQGVTIANKGTYILEIVSDENHYFQRVIVE